jgi:hypothetical protein
MTPARSEYANPDSLRLEVQALTDFLCSNKIEVLKLVDTLYWDCSIDGDRISVVVFEWNLHA